MRKYKKRKLLYHIKRFLLLRILSKNFRYFVIFCDTKDEFGVNRKLARDFFRRQVSHNAEIYREVSEILRSNYIKKRNFNIVNLQIALPLCYWDTRFWFKVHQPEVCAHESTIRTRKQALTANTKGNFVITNISFGQSFYRRKSNEGHIISYRSS